jgi:hypothetical protein
MRSAIHPAELASRRADERARRRCLAAPQQGSHVIQICRGEPELELTGWSASTSDVQHSSGAGSASMRGTNTRYVLSTLLSRGEQYPQVTDHRRTISCRVVEVFGIVAKSVGDRLFVSMRPIKTSKCLVLYPGTARI